MSKRAKPRVELAPEFPVLDTMRAIGALAVLTTHTAFQAGDYLRHGVLGSLLSRLDVGVAIFFVLSGFLLSRPWFARAATGRAHPAVGRYYRKRLLRIYPVYAVTVVVAFTLIPANKGRTPGEWATALLLGDAYVESRLDQGLTQMWSLAVEVAFYAVLPLVMWLAIGRGDRLGRVGRRRVAAVLVALVVLAGWWHLDLADRVQPLTSGNPMMWLPGYLAWFAVGIGFAAVHVQSQADRHPNPAVRALHQLGALPGTCWVLAGGLMLVAATPVAGPTLLYVATPGQSLAKNLLYAVVAGLVVLPGIFGPAGSRYVRVLSWGPLRHLGHISFSIFCIHLPILWGVVEVAGFQVFAGHGLEMWSLTVGLTLVASEALYRLVERPFMRLAHAGTARAPGPAAAPPTRKEDTTTTR